jgi:hypothetical protein
MPPPKSKTTRTGPRRFVPRIVTCSPPVGRPTSGETDVMVGAVLGGVGPVVGARNVIVVDCEVLPTNAVTVYVPATVEVTVTEVVPPVVVLIVEVPAAPSSVRLVLFDTNSTAVPFGAGWPPTVTVAVTVVELPATGLGLATASVIVAPVGGVEPPPGPVVGGGAVGDSPLHAVNSARTASSAITDLLCLILII